MIENTNDQELIKKALLEFFPDECSIAGDTTVSKIAAGNTAIVRTKGGRNFDITAIISLLVSSATLITHIITISKAFKKEKKAAPGKTTINIQNMTVDHPEIPEELQGAILQFIMSQLDTHGDEQSKN